MNADNPYFWAWVSNTVYAISGIRPQHWCDVQRKYSLTYDESRAVACQEPGASIFDWCNSGFSGGALIATTNKGAIH